MPETVGSFRSRLTKLPVGSGADLDLIDGFINQRIEQLCRAFPWTRLAQQSTLQLLAEYITGTVTILAGATSGTGSGTTFTAAMTGRLFRPGNRADFYTFTFVSSTSFTIDRALEGDDDLTAVAFRIWQPIYALPANLESIQSLRNPTLGGEMDERTREWLDGRDASRTQGGSPFVYVPAEDTAAGLPQIEVYPGPTAAEGLPMDWRAGPPLFDFEGDDDVDAVEFPNWISIPAVFAGVKADLYGLAGDSASANREEMAFMGLAKEMQGEDIRRMPNSELQIHDRYTMHRRARASRGGFMSSPFWWRSAG